jgi:hypothetical protein
MTRPFLLIAIAVTALLVLTETASAHSWYTRTNCCNGNDCAEVPADAGWVVMERHGYQITLTLEQAKLVNPEATVPINAFIPWRDGRIKVPPVLKPGETYGGTIYHLCIAAHANSVRCLFVVPGT